jgi:hypothetical protein
MSPMSLEDLMRLACAVNLNDYDRTYYTLKVGHAMGFTSGRRIGVIIGMMLGSSVALFVTFLARST